MGSTVNSAGYDALPAITKDGRSLYISSSRGSSDPLLWDIWVAHRRSEHEPWGAPVRLPDGVNTPYNDAGVAISRDGQWMVFFSNRPGGYGKNDLWASRRRHVHDDFGWEAPVNLGPAINTAEDEAAATFFEGARGAVAELYFGSARNGLYDIFVSRMGPDGWQEAELVPELSSEYADTRPQITADGRELYLQSPREGSVVGANGMPSADLWVSRRDSPLGPWEPPRNVSEVNTSYNEVQHGVSPDGCTLMFASNRPDPLWQGLTDLYVSTRDENNGHGKNHGHGKGHGRCR
jgi:hypothetical protein